jgi:hypothetical protein
MSDKKTIVRFCPNCGKPVEASEYFSFQGIALAPDAVQSPINSRIICSRCNYGGTPLETTMEEFKKADFSNWKPVAPPIQNASPTYRFLSRAVIFILFVSIELLLLQYSPLLALFVFIVAAVWFWKLK